MEKRGNETLSRNGPSQRLGPAKRIYTSKTNGNRGKYKTNSYLGKHPWAAKKRDYPVDFENRRIFAPILKICTVTRQ